MNAPDASSEDLEVLDDDFEGDEGFDADAEFVEDDEDALALEDDEVPAEEGVADADDVATVVELPTEEDEDDEEDEDVLVRVVEDDDEDLEADSLREGEFICAACFLAKGPTQLADARRLVCVDCV